MSFQWIESHKLADNVLDICQRLIRALAGRQVLAHTFLFVDTCVHRLARRACGWCLRFGGRSRLFAADADLLLGRQPVLDVVTMLSAAGVVQAISPLSDLTFVFLVNVVLCHRFPSGIIPSGSRASHLEYPGAFACTRGARQRCYLYL